MSRNGLPPTGAKAFGRFGRIACKRVPSPPQRIATSTLDKSDDIFATGAGLIMVVVRIIHDLAAEMIEPRRYVEQMAESLAHLLLLIRPHVKQHEAAASGAKELTAEGSCFQAGVVDRIDFVIGNFLRHVALEQPLFVQEPAEIIQRVALAL